MRQGHGNESLVKLLANASAIFGTSNSDVQSALLKQVALALWPPSLGEERATINTAALATLHEMMPQDIFEGQLASQMVGTHNAAMECFKQAAEASGDIASMETYLRLAAKFSNLYLQQLDGLDRRRGKGTSQVNVGAVNVQAGGQAIVGSVEAKPQQKRKRPAHRPTVQALTSDPVTPLDLGPPVSLAEDDKAIKQPVSRRIR